MQRITSRILNNRILNILFNPNLLISKHEYWAGLIFLFFCMAISYTLNSIGNITDPFLFGHKMDFQALIFSKQIFSSFTPRFIPHASIILYASFILSYKRCKTIQLDKLRWISGLFTFLLYCTPMAIIMIGVVTGQSFISDNTELGLHSSIIVGALFIIGILTILILSFGGSSVIEDEQESTYGPIGILFRLFMLYIGFCIILALYIFVTNIQHASPSPEYLILLYILVLVYLFAHIWLIIKRTIDAGINIFIPIGIMLITLIIVASFYFLGGNDLLPNNPIIIGILSLSVSVVFSIANTLFLILLILPSQSGYGIEEDNTLPFNVD